MDVKVGSGHLCRPTNSLKPLPKRLLAWLRRWRAYHRAAHRYESGTGLRAGNAVEVREAVQFLTGEYRTRVCLMSRWRCA